MTQEKKELVLKDLCARLPYSTLCYCKWTKNAPNGTSGCVQEVSTYLLEELMIIGDQNYECQICEIKPYLRPLSSMTVEQREELSDYLCEQVMSNKIGITIPPNPTQGKGIPFIWMGDCLNWLNAHHFDYRGLIEKGLALEAPEDMYKSK